MSNHDDNGVFFEHVFTKVKSYDELKTENAALAERVAEVERERDEKEDTLLAERKAHEEETARAVEEANTLEMTIEELRAAPTPPRPSEGRAACGRCMGSGWDGGGRSCDACAGTGRAPAERDAARQSIDLNLLAERDAEIASLRASLAAAEEALGEREDRLAVLEIFAREMRIAHPNIGNSNCRTCIALRRLDTDLAMVREAHPPAALGDRARGEGT